MTSPLTPRLALPAVPTSTARRALREVFGYPEFRPGQREVIEAVLAGRDTLAVMPTGAGKSICYQLPALLFEQGLTLVVSPLLALMKDQVDALGQAGVAATAINSTVPREEQRWRLGEAAAGRLRLLYVAPERFDDGGFVAALRGLKVALLAIDEAHCISQWGHDFRPSYRGLGRVRDMVGGPPIVALTATAYPLVREDIVARLALRDPAVLVAGFDRPNLRLDVVRVRTQKEKAPIIAERLRALGKESAIVYCGTRKKTEDLTDALQRQGVRSARYHGGMEDADRQRIQEAFARDSVRVIVATNAFGMGIDKPDVRAVIHHDTPDSLESYYQEAGRAGRDGAPAECLLLFAPRDRSLHEFFIGQAHPPAERILEIYRALAARGGERLHVRDLSGDDDESGVNAALQTLEASKLVGRRGQMAWATGAGGEEALDLAELEAHRRHAFKKLDAMQYYAESSTCLRTRILDYFGDSGHGPACGNCGPCAAPIEATPAATEAGATGDLFQELRTLRRRFADEGNVPPYVIFSDATLREMVARRPRTRAEMLNVAGMGKVKWERYGEAFLAVTRAAAPSPPAAAPPTVAFRARDGAALGESVRRTWELVRQGLDLDAIAARRGFSRSTVASHVAALVSHGEVEDISPWVSAALLARIRRAAPPPIGPLGPLKEALGDEASYEQLHLVRAYINREAELAKR